MSIKARGCSEKKKNNSKEWWKKTGFDKENIRNKVIFNDKNNNYLTIEIKKEELMRC